MHVNDIYLTFFDSMHFNRSIGQYLSILGLYIKVPIMIMCLPVFVCLHRLLTRVLFVIFLLLTLFNDVICYVSEVVLDDKFEKGV